MAFRYMIIATRDYEINKYIFEHPMRQQTRMPQIRISRQCAAIYTITATDAIQRRIQIYIYIIPCMQTSSNVIGYSRGVPFDATADF